MNIVLNRTEENVLTCHDYGRDIDLKVTAGDYRIIEILIERHPEPIPLKALAAITQRSAEGVKQTMVNLRGRFGERFIGNVYHKGYVIRPINQGDPITKIPLDKALK